jgi:8-oxo-dGTP pyrophosphatase MutT (NUDIX family)
MAVQVEPEAPSALDLDEIRIKLAHRVPRVLDDGGGPFASVAMIFAGGPHDPTMLFIERAHRLDDPWSGHMAFPGGRIDADDLDSRRTAERETLEEVGVDLQAAELLGRLDDQEGRRAGRLAGRSIAGYVYHLEDEVPLALNHEVAEALWVPTSALVLPANRVDYTVSYAPGVFPGILVGKPDRHIIWGLTYRFLQAFLGLLDRKLP